MDSQNIEITFDKLGYHVEIYKNYTYDDTENQLEVIGNYQSLCSLIIIVLSHGGMSRNKFFTSDGKDFDFVKIQRKFTDTRCPVLKGKPKLLLGNFCKGTDEELLVNNDTVVYKEDDSSMEVQNIENSLLKEVIHLIHHYHQLN